MFIHVCLLRMGNFVISGGSSCHIMKITFYKLLILLCFNSMFLNIKAKFDAFVLGVKKFTNSK